MLLTLGSNIDPAHNLGRGVRELDIALGVGRVSSVYEGEPVGAPETPRFLNAAVELRTTLDPGELKFRVLRSIEARLGRVRTADPNAPRTIDIDIALVGTQSFEDADRLLRIPDPDIARFAHLAVPLSDLEPDLRHPALPGSLAELAARLVGEDLSRRDDLDLEPWLLDADPDPT